MRRWPDKRPEREGQACAQQRTPDGMGTQKLLKQTKNQTQPGLDFLIRIEDDGAARAMGKPRGQR
jgi:hypothetical protein